MKKEDFSLVHESVTDEEIARIISRWTGIPVAKLTESERNKTLHLDEELHKRVIGQDEGCLLYTSGWFHYAKLYAAVAGCIGFMMLKYKWGIGKKEWFKPFPFIIVAINILIAVCSDFESAIRGAQAFAKTLSLIHI